MTMVGVVAMATILSGVGLVLSGRGQA